MEATEILGGIALALVAAILTFALTTSRSARTVERQLAVVITRLEGLDRDLSSMIGVVKTVGQLEVRMHNIEGDVDALATAQRKHLEDYRLHNRGRRDE